MRPRTLRAVVLGQLAAVGEMLKRGCALRPRAQSRFRKAHPRRRDQRLSLVVGPDRSRAGVRPISTRNRTDLGALT